MKDMNLAAMSSCMAKPIFGFALLFAAGAACADAPPAMHWGELDMKTSVKNCVGRSHKAFNDAGVRNSQRTGWVRYGEKGKANVLVSCTPLQNGSSYLVVTASSNDSKAAELLRNDIRSRISRMREFD
jgi:hypothetical protein